MRRYARLDQRILELALPVQRALAVRALSIVPPSVIGGETAAKVVRFDDVAKARIRLLARRHFVADEPMQTLNADARTAFVMVEVVIAHMSEKPTIVEYADASGFGISHRLRSPIDNQ